MIRTSVGEHGMTVVELLVVIAIIGIISGIAFPIYLNTTANAVKNSEKTDLMTATTKVESLLTEWRGAPKSQIAIDSTEGVWTATAEGLPSVATGKLNNKVTKLTGAIFTDGSYCLTADNTGGNKISYRSDTQVSIENEDCPTEGFGGTGTLPASTTVTLPGLVTNLTATSPADNQVIVTWDPTVGADAYTVQIAGIAPLTVTGITEATLVGVAPGDSVQVTVYAKNTDGAGAGVLTVVTVGGETDTTSLEAMRGIQTNITTLESQLGSLTDKLNAISTRVGNLEASQAPTPTPTPAPAP